MKIIIQKFGGTSVRDEETRQFAKKHVEAAIADGFKVVVVVSAMGRKGEAYATDTLLSLINGDNTKLTGREQDQLMSCGEIISSIVFTQTLVESGVKACAYTGGQAGFRTNADHLNAKILDVKTERLLKELEAVDVVVVAGFQGITSNGDVTTIGRGGSDTSAAALGAALYAQSIDIFTDVDGMMTADPRVSPKARPLDVVTYMEVSNMAYEGAQVIHPRAVEIAMQAKVPLRIRSTYGEGLGTLVTFLDEDPNAQNRKNRLVTGIAHVSHLTQIKVMAKKEEQAILLQAEVFQAMADANISVDFINIYPSGVIYTVSEAVSERAIAILEKLNYKTEIVRDCAKVSVVGARIAGVPGVTSKIVSALAEKGIQILQSADSHTTIWVLVKQADLRDAVNALHDTFHLEEDFF